jgi:hypothetical protein
LTTILEKSPKRIRGIIKIFISSKKDLNNIRTKWTGRQMRPLKRRTEDSEKRDKKK